VSAWTNYSYLFGPLTVAGVLGLLVLLLRWAFSSGHSLVEKTPRPGDPSQYGLLVDVAAPPTYIEGESARRKLEAHGIRATLVQTSDGPRIMVFRPDEGAARAVLSQDKWS
jgi:hypothetical protein